MKQDFVDWLDEQLKIIDRNQAWLARQAHLDPGFLNRVMNHKANIGAEGCSRIAKALGLRDIEVLRIAGIADPEPPTDTPTIRDMNTEFAQLSEADQEFWLRALRGYNAERRQHGETRKPD